MIAGYLQQVVDTLIEAREASLPTEGATVEAAAEFAAALIQANAVPLEPRTSHSPDAAPIGDSRPNSPDAIPAGRSPEPPLPQSIPARDVAGGTEIAVPEARPPVTPASPKPPDLRAPVLQSNAEVAQRNETPAEPLPARSLPPVEGREPPPPITGEPLRREPSRSPALAQRVERSSPELETETPVFVQSARRTTAESPPLRDKSENLALNLPERRESAPATTTPLERSWILERSPVAPAPHPPSPELVASSRNTAPPLPPEGASRIVQDVSWLASRGGGQARVRLHPPELGEIELAVRVRNQDVAITIRAHESRALVALTEGKELLLEGLAGRDLRAAQLQIMRGGADESPAARDGESRGFQDASGDRPGSDRGQHDAENRSRLPRAFGETRPADLHVTRSAKPTDEGAPSRGAVDIRI